MEDEKDTAKSAGPERKTKSAWPIWSRRGSGWNLVGVVSGLLNPNDFQRWSAGQETTP